MSISEKSLELNITHELLSFADSLWMMIFKQNSYNSNVIYPNRMRNQIPVALGLSLQEEKKQGWDVKINFPSSSFKHRAAFIQYKKPYFRNYCKNKSSIYHGTKSNKQPHYLFGINNNTPKDQHIKLRALANNNHISNSVLYALPRILNQKELQQWSGSLVNFTSFMTIKELDNIASTLGVNINTGDNHEIRMLSSGELKEIHSEPNILDISDNTSKNIISDIISWRMNKSINLYANNLDDNLEIKKHIRIRKFRECYLNLALYFPISVDNVVNNDFKKSDKKTIERNYNSFIELYRINHGKHGLEKLLYNIANRFDESYQKIAIYEHALSDEKYLSNISLPYKSEYLASFVKDGNDASLTLKFEEDINFSNINYTVM